jgi:hypothetical protein
MAELLLGGFEGRSGWLREVAYRQAGRLPMIPDEIAVEIRRALVELTAVGRLQREWRTTKAQVMRLRPPAAFLASARVLRLAPTIDLLACAAGVLGAILLFEPSLGLCLALILGGIGLHWSYYDSASLIAGGIRITSFAHGRGGLRQAALGATGPLEGLVVMFMLQLRGITAIVPAALAIGTSWELFGLAILWLYALSWSLAATVLTIRRPPSTTIGWALAPLRFVPKAASTLRKVTLKGTAAAILLMIALVLFFYGVSQLSSTLQVVLVVLVLGAITFSGLVSLVQEASAAFRDQLWIWRWSKQHGPQISSTEFLECLSEAPGSRGTSVFISAVRVKRLLREDREAEETVHDLLLAIKAIQVQVRLRASGKETEPAQPTWRSAAFRTWSDQNEAVVGRLFWNGTEDLLGQLLEDLGQEEEIPVA